MLDLQRVCDERDSRYDGAFVVAVRTTRIYCRPSCSGRPLPRNRSFLPSPAAARREGYRACKRCKPDEAARLDLDFFAARAVAGIEEIRDGVYRRTLRDGGMLSSTDDSPLARRLRDEDADLLAVNEVLSADPVLAPLVVGRAVATRTRPRRRLRAGGPGDPRPAGERRRGPHERRDAGGPLRRAARLPGRRAHAPVADAGGAARRRDPRPADPRRGDPRAGCGVTSISRTARTPRRCSNFQASGHGPPPT